GRCSRIPPSVPAVRPRSYYSSVLAEDNCRILSYVCVVAAVPIRRILWGPNRVLDGILQRTVVDAVPISAFNSLPPVIGDSVDLLGRRKWRLRCCGRGWIFAFYWYA